MIDLFTVGCDKLWIVNALYFDLSSTQIHDATRCWWVINISLDRAGFEPCRVVGFMPDVADREPARKLESIVEWDGFGSGMIFDDGLLHGTAQIQRGHA